MAKIIFYLWEIDCKGCEQGFVDERDMSHMVEGPTFLSLPDRGPTGI